MMVPDSNDETRIEIAKATSKFLKYWWEQTGIHRKTRDIFLNNGVKAGVPQKCILMRKLVRYYARKGSCFEEEMGSLYTGEIRCRICDPLTLYVDPGAEMDEEIRWMWKESHVTLIISKNGMGKMCRQMRM